MDIDFRILNGIFSKITDIKNNLSSTDTNKPLSAKQGKILNEIKISHEDYLYIDTVNSEITYDDDSTNTIPLLADIREINGILKVAIVWNDNYNESNKRPSSVSVQLLRNDSPISTYVLNADNNWQYKLNVPLDDGQGNSYSYSWRESSVAGYYSRKTTDGNLCIINMTPLSSSSGDAPGDAPQTPT